MKATGFVIGALISAAGLYIKGLLDERDFYQKTFENYKTSAEFWSSRYGSMKNQYEGEMRESEKWKGRCKELKEENYKLREENEGLKKHSF